MTEKDYLDLITSTWKNKPKFISTVKMEIAVPLRVQDLLSQLPALFDVDFAVGDQLDKVGEWVGISRNVAIPTTNIFFSWDADYSLGWDFGNWQPTLAPTTITALPDDAYRTLIRAKIASNRWDGTTDGAYAIFEAVFPQFTILIQDHQDMSYDLAVVGGIVDTLTLALLRGGYIPLKPEGVHVNVYFVSTGTSPSFSWDVESTLLQGWDEGSWLRELAPT